MMVPATDIGNLAQGQRVHMRMSQHLPTPLMLVGTVKTIDTESTLTKRESTFGVVVVFHLTKKNERILRYGMSGQGAIVTGRQTYWQYLWSQMRAK